VRVQHDGDDRAQGHGKRERSRVEPMAHARDAHQNGIGATDCSTLSETVESNNLATVPRCRAILEEQISNEHTMAGPSALRTAALDGGAWRERG
jgi:hypothetical protein